MNKPRILSTCLAVALVLVSCQEGKPSPSQTLRRGVGLSGLVQHLRELQRIADANGGTRAAGTDGYDASAEYVYRVLRRAGYDVEFDEFRFAAFQQLEPSTLARTGSPQQQYADGRDFRAMIYSASGEVKAEIEPIGFDSSGESSSVEGCDAGDFRGLQRGAVAVMPPGPCLRRDQVLNAQRAGASAAIVAYPNISRGSAIRPTLISPQGISIPALAATREVGQALNAASDRGEAVRISTHTRVGQRTTASVIAETTQGRDDNVVMVGGHLDSVVDGPGINDNGSGVATILEVARRIAAMRPHNTVRFAFWSAEEYGLLGSTHYVNGLADGDLRHIALYLNFDMLASPNFVPFVYDDTGAPTGSDAIERVFLDYLRREELNAEPLDLQGRSDHGPFLRAGIPVGGLFTGAEEMKTERQASRYGGVAGAPEDPCYHQPCDSLDNINQKILDEMADAVAHAVVTFATSTKALDKQG